MKKGLMISVLLMSFFVFSNVNASSFIMIDSYFQISGEIGAVNMTDPADPPNFNVSYSENSTSPLIDSIERKYGLMQSFYAYSEATLNNVIVRVSVPGSQSGSTFAKASAETQLLFKPNFVGEGPPMQFSAWGLRSEISIFDRTSGEGIVDCDWHCGFIGEFSYSGWDPNHVYSLNMLTETSDSNYGDEHAGASHNMSFVFVPEPATMLLLGLGLIGLAGIRRKIRK